MRRIFLSLAATTLIITAASLAPAQAMSVGTAAGINSALADTSVLDEVRYVCRHRHWRSGRVCFWQPGWRHRHRR